MNVTHRNPRSRTAELMPAIPGHPPAGRRVLEALDGVAMARTVREAAEHGLAAMAAFVPGDFLSATLFSQDGRRLEIFHADGGWLPAWHPTAVAFQRALTLGRRHPFLDAFRPTDRAGGFVRSRLLADRDWHRHEFYQTVDRTLGIADMATAMITPSAGHVLAFNCGRARRFTADAVDILMPLSRTLAALIARGPKLDCPAVNVRLTPREAEVLRLVERGDRNATIAGVLSVSPGTVRRHLENVFQKLGVGTRTAAVRAAREAGLMDG